LGILCGGLGIGMWSSDAVFKFVFILEFVAYSPAYNVLKPFKIPT